MTTAIPEQVEEFLEALENTTEKYECGECGEEFESQREALKHYINEHSPPQSGT